MDSFSSYSFGSQFSSLNRRRRSRDSPNNNLGQISPVVQHHLKQVYLCLSCALLALGVGVYLHILCNYVGGLLTFLASVRCFFRLKSTPFHGQEHKKVFLLMATSLLGGATIGHLAQRAIQFDPSIVFSGFIGCSLCFGCIFGAAMLPRCREHLYRWAMLSSCLSILLWLHLASFIFGASIMALLKFKMLVFVDFIVKDTQDIIEKAWLGDLDYVDHALTLLFDFNTVFDQVLKMGAGYDDFLWLKNVFKKIVKK